MKTKAMSAMFICFISTNNWAASGCLLLQANCTDSCIPIPYTTNCGAPSCCHASQSQSCYCIVFNQEGYCMRCGWKQTG